MKTFIINSWRGVVTQKKKFDVTSKLMGREWRMLSDDRTIIGKYIFLKDGKLLISVNGLSTYSSWQMATDSSVIVDEGVATFLYKVFHIDDNLIVLNLDGTDNFCFLINDASTSLANASLEDIQWYLYRHCNIDMLTPEQKEILRRNEIKVVTGSSSEEQQSDPIPMIILVTSSILIFILLMVFAIGSSL